MRRSTKKKKITLGHVMGLAGIAGLVLLFVVRKKADEEGYHPVAAKVADETDQKDWLA